MNAKYPRTSPPARLIMCERTGRWAVTLRRELAGLGVRVWETRTFDDCLAELTQSPASIVVLELTSNVDLLMPHVARQQRRFPDSNAAVVSDYAMAAYEPLMREAGVVDFISSPRQAGRLARLVCRHLAQVPPPQQSMTDRVWTNLPWGDR